MFICLFDFILRPHVEVQITQHQRLFLVNYMLDRKWIYGVPELFYMLFYVEHYHLTTTILTNYSKRFISSFGEEIALL